LVPSADPPLAAASVAELAAGAPSAALKDGSPDWLRMRGGKAASSRVRGGTGLDAALRQAIERSLVAACGDHAKAAAMLGISRAVLYHKMVRYGLTFLHQTRSPQ
jgi:DNA-binding NtrC family response regulator